MKENSLYIGEIEHRRLAPRENFFTYSVCYYFVDLEKAGSIFKVPLLFSFNSPGLLSFWQKDYLSSDTVRSLISSETKKSFSGRIQILTNISYFGFCFNPVSFYYCYNGEDLEFIVSEITNTPWGEKHQQVFDLEGKDKKAFFFPKNFHVSPFLPMNIDYTWVFRRPDEELYVLMQDRLSDEKEIIFDSTLSLKRKELTTLNVIGAFLRFPFLTLKTMVAIYYQALKLFLKKVPFYTHPTKSKETVYDNSNLT